MGVETNADQPLGSGGRVSASRQSPVPKLASMPPPLALVLFPVTFECYSKSPPSNTKKTIPEAWLPLTVESIRDAEAAPENRIPAPLLPLTVEVVSEPVPTPLSGAAPKEIPSPRLLLTDESVRETSPRPQPMPVPPLSLMLERSIVIRKLRPPATPAAAFNRQRSGRVAASDRLGDHSPARAPFTQGPSRGQGRPDRRPGVGASCLSPAGRVVKLVSVHRRRQTRDMKRIRKATTTERSSSRASGS